MRPRNRRLLALGVAACSLAALGLGTAPALATSELTSIGPPTPFAVWQKQMIWSAPDGSGSYQLLTRVGDGDIRRIPVAKRPIPFDVDLGPTSSGGTYAVYSRCDVDPGWDGTQMPDYRLGKRCDIYKLDMATLKETRYTEVNSADGSEYWPSYWKGTVAFARAYEKNPAEPYLYSKKVSSSRAFAAPARRRPRLARVVAASDRDLRLADRVRLVVSRREGGSGLRPSRRHDRRFAHAPGQHARRRAVVDRARLAVVRERARLLGSRVRGRSGRLLELAPLPAGRVQRIAAAEGRGVARLRPGARARRRGDVERDGRQLDLRLREQPGDDVLSAGSSRSRRTSPRSVERH